MLLVQSYKSAAGDIAEEHRITARGLLSKPKVPRAPSLLLFSLINPKALYHGIDVEAHATVELINAHDCSS